MNNYPSEKASGADNQQERLEIESWLVGFTDGEGCFSVSFIKNKTAKNGWQIFPEFVITQGEKSLPALKIFQKYFKCGNIFVNRRYDNHNENIYRFCVRRIGELQERIIPFFVRHKLRTAKKNDFANFAKIVRSMAAGRHLTPRGAIKIAKLTERMNRKKASRFLKSSETTR